MARIPRISQDPERERKGRGRVENAGGIWKKWGKEKGGGTGEENNSREAALSPASSFCLLTFLSLSLWFLVFSILPVGPLLLTWFFCKQFPRFSGHNTSLWIKTVLPTKSGDSLESAAPLLLWISEAPPIKIRAVQWKPHLNWKFYKGLWATLYLVILGFGI